MSTKKLVISTYLQYILIALGVVLSFLLAAILAYVLDPLVRRLEGWRIPRVMAVTGVLLALVLAVLAALLVLIIPAAGQIEALVQNPTVLAVFAVPIVAIIASRYLRGALLFERWRKAHVFPAPLEVGER